MAPAVSVIGQAFPRVEGHDKVTGAAAYTADVVPSGRLWGKLLRSPLPHARIVSIDASEARRLPGVRAVVTAADLPALLIGRAAKDQPLLCHDRVRFVGDPVAAVAADDPEIAEQALNLIEVEYEELPAIFDAVEALRDDTRLVHEHPESYRGRPKGLPDLPNLQSYTCWEVGDVDRGFAEADQVFEQTFTTQRVHQLYLEPHTCTIGADDSGRLQVWASNKMPYAVRRWVAEAAVQSLDDVIVNPVRIGGDYGGKGDHLNLHLCCFLAKMTGRPVTMMLSYVEELTAANPRHSATIVLRTGMKSDGRLWARHAHLVFDGGAYAGYKPHPTGGLGGADKSGGPYRIQHSKIESFVAYTNSVPGGHYRGPGSVQSLFAVESHMDTIAREMGIDPIELRLINAIQDGDRAPDGHHWTKILFTETLQRASQVSGWDTPKTSPSIGRGVSAGYHHIGNGEAGAAIELGGDGSVALLTATPDTGTGSHSIFGQFVAEVLQRPVEEVAVRQAPTGLVANDSGVGASRVTNVAGHATMKAAEQMREALLETAAGLLECAPSEVELRDGIFRVSGQSTGGLTWSEIAQAVTRQHGDPFQVKATYATKEEMQEKSFVVHLVEVEVDRETGAVSVLGITTVDEVGPIINPTNVQGQLEGGLAQGLGFALMEHLPTEDGRVTAVGLHDYKIPTIRDMPPLRTVLITGGEGPGPFGAKAVSELTISSIAPAIANAVYDAVGVRITDLPITAEKVYRALNEAEHTRGRADRATSTANRTL
ncbi:MAG: hypothetical protein HW416_97 [Chloroflexi bacterium]|nr:hypothetical protein [Chloroflexota bacterium]